MSARIFAAGACASIAICCGILGAACSPRATGRGADPVSSAKNECITTGSPPPPGSGILPVQYPGSQVTIAGQISERWLNTQLDEHVPVVVAEEKDRPIGAAGRASYRIKRGGLTLEQRAGVLRATLPLSLDISVCKPFGSGCFRYGSCTPRLDIEMLLDGELSADYEVSSPSLASITREGCRIGIDVTPQIESTARSELSKIQRQVDRTFSQVDESVASWAAAPHPPLVVWPEQCVSWSVTGIRQRPLRLENLDKDADPPGKHLTLGLEAVGQLVLSDCDTQATVSPHPLPAPRTAQSLPKLSLVYLPELVSLDALRTALHTQLDGVLGPHRIAHVQLASDGVYLKIEFGGAKCGSSWFKAPMRVSDDALLFDQPVALSPSLAGSEQLLEEVQTTLAKHFALPLLGTSFIKRDGKDWLKRLIAPARVQLTPQDLDVALSKVQSKPAIFQVATDGIYVFHRASFQLRLSGAQRRSDRVSSLELESD